MCNIKEIARIVEDLRKQMNHLILSKSSLLDPNIIAVSQLLDVILVEYYKVLNSNVE